MWWWCLTPGEPTRLWLRQQVWLMSNTGKRCNLQQTFVQLLLYDSYSQKKHGSVDLLIIVAGADNRTSVEVFFRFVWSWIVWLVATEKQCCYGKWCTFNTLTFGKVFTLLVLFLRYHHLFFILVLSKMILKWFSIGLSSFRNQVYLVTTVLELFMWQSHRPRWTDSALFPGMSWRKWNSASKHCDDRGRCWLHLTLLWFSCW